MARAECAGRAAIINLRDYVALVLLSQPRLG